MTRHSEYICKRAASRYKLVFCLLAILKIWSKLQCQTTIVCNLRIVCFDDTAMSHPESHQNAPTNDTVNNRTQLPRHPIACSKCGKRFSHVDVVKRHLKNGRCKTIDPALTRSKRDDYNRQKRLKVTIRLNSKEWEIQREVGQKWKCPNSCGKNFGRDDTL